MIIENLKALFERDLKRLKTEIELYQHEDKIWYIENNISNSAGNLCLHLIGNLNAFVGAVIGKTNYVRQRDLEFSTKNISKADLVRKIEDTIQVVNSSLDKLTEEELKNEYPIIVFAEKMTTEYFLLHLTTHLTYHLGQINYHRRIFDK